MKGPQTKFWSALEDHERFSLVCTMASDLEQARQAIVLSEHFPLIEKDIQKRLLFACIAEMVVVRYARAFSLCNLVGGAQRAKVNPDEFTIDFDERERKVHSLFLEMRDSTTTHSDHDARSITIFPIPGSKTVATRVTHHWPSVEELASAKVMIQKISALAARMIELMASDASVVERSGVRVARDAGEFSTEMEHLPFGEITPYKTPART